MHGTTLAILAAIAHEFAERETRERGGRLRLPPVVVRPRLPRRGRTAHGVQPIPRPAADRDARRDRRRAARADRDLQFRHARGAALARRRAAPSIAPQLEALRAGAGPTAPPARRSRRSPAPRSRSRQARPPLLGASGLARRRGRGNDDGGSGRGRRVRRGARSAPPSPSSTASSARWAAAHSPRCRRCCRSAATTNGRSPN